MMHVQITTTNPDESLKPLDVTFFLNEIQKKYRDRVIGDSRRYWRINSIDSAGDNIILVVPSGSNVHVLSDCVQESFPRHGIVAKIV